MQLVRSTLGRDAREVDLSRVNISSCGFVVTLHGVVAHPGERRSIEESVRRVPGVLGVEGKLAVERDC